MKSRTTFYFSVAIYWYCRTRINQHLKYPYASSVLKRCFWCRLIFVWLVGSNFLHFLVCLVRRLLNWYVCSCILMYIQALYPYHLSMLSTCHRLFKLPLGAASRLWSVTAGFWVIYFDFFFYSFFFFCSRLNTLYSLLSVIYVSWFQLLNWLTNHIKY